MEGDAVAANGLTFCDALKQKYCTATDLDCLDNIILKNKDTILQQQNHEKKCIMGLDHCNVSRCGDSDEIKKTCPLVEELDLSSNLLTEWDEILNITKQLVHLTYVNLSHNSLNHLSLPGHCSEIKNNAILKKLVLNSTQTDFKTTVKILQLFPSVHELHLSMNGISEVPETLVDTFNSLKTLHFAKNEVSNWHEVEKIGKLFPCLSNLNICETPIECIPENINPQEAFPCLEKLNIMDTKISDWDSIDQLRNFPCLSEVRIKGSPVYKKMESEKENRQLTIARLPNIKYLNGSMIDFEEREGAERMFIRFHMKKNEKPERYSELVNRYGELDELVVVNMKKDIFCNVLITGDIDSPLIMAVDTTKTVAHLCKQIAEKFKLKSSLIHLIHFEQNEDILAKFGGICMVQRNKTLTRYFVEEGNTIQVVVVDRSQYYFR